jgi:hypothetical protein
MQFWVDGLADDPLVAAAIFHADVLPTVRRMLDMPQGNEPGQLVLIFSPADHTHRAWRVAAVQSLARKYAPSRVNAIASYNDVAIAAATRYLADAPGVTGQYLPLDGIGAGTSLS